MNLVQGGESTFPIMKRFISLFPALAAVCLLPCCDLAKLSADGEKRKLKQQVAQLEKEREEAALDAELEEARRQLAIALSANKEGDPVVEGELVDSAAIDSNLGELVEFEDIPRAIVVEEASENDDFRPSEGNAVALEATVPVALLNTGDHQIFFAELSRFGEWLQTRDYGFVWQPTALRTDPAWRPYTRGRWVNSDQGWTWLSDEPFGWAVYHYGRWILVAQHGWVWVPGDDWAPAWVSWRQNDDYLGWAPLPPETLYDEVYDYDAGIDLAYDVSPDYYNFVPVDQFYEPVYSHCVPRETVITIVIRTRNVTRFSMQDNRVHCGGPDFAWVNRHARRPARRCQIDLGIGRDHFAHRHHHRLHENRIHIFAPRVDASWNAAVCPSRVARNLGRVEAVRAGKREIKRELRYRHHEARVRRHEAAREAIESPECQVALRNNQQQRRDAGGLPHGEENPVEERQRRRARAEEGLRAATEAVAAAERRVEDRKLQPGVRVEARRKIDQAEKELAVVRASLNTGRNGGELRPGRRGNAENPPVEDKRAEMARQQAVEAKQRALLEEKVADEKRRVLAEQKAAEAKRLNMARQQAVEAKRRALADEKVADEKRRVLAEQKVAEDKRLDMDRQRAAEAKQRALVEERAAEEKRRVLAEQQAAEAKRIAKAREQAAEAKQRALVEEKAEETKRRALAQQQAEADERKRQALAREKAEETKRRALAEQKVVEAKRAELARQKSEETKRRALAEQKQVEARRAELARQQALARQKAEEVQRRALAERKQAEARRADLARQQAAEVKRRALAQQQAEADARKRALAQQKTEEARRQALARQKMEESRRRAELDARRKAQIDVQRRAEADRARVEAQRRSQIEEQRRAAALQARRQAEAQQAARARAQAQAQVKARAEAQAAARRQKTDAIRREAAKTSRSRKTR